MEDRLSEPTDADLIQQFIRDLDDHDAMIHTNRINAIGAYDTTSWGQRTRRLIADTLREALERK